MKIQIVKTTKHKKCRRHIQFSKIVVVLSVIFAFCAIAFSLFICYKNCFDPTTIAVTCAAWVTSVCSIYQVQCSQERINKVKHGDLDCNIYNKVETSANDKDKDGFNI